MVSDRETVVAGNVARERELVGLFALYVERLNTGEEIHPQEILARHPRLGADLLACLEDYVDPDAPPHAMAGRLLGDYTLLRELGRGGMGVVYDAWQNSLDRRVALKVLPLGVAASDKAFERFMREARTAAKLDHQNIVRVHGMGIEADTPYYSMEHVEGRTLAQILAPPETDFDHAADGPFAPTKEGKVDYAGVACLFAEIADGLHHAHDKGVIHRDIKPSNLILDRLGHVRILDFGLARFEGEASLTITGDILGTPLYMSPEQARRRQIPVDHRTDIYSLGATLYEVLAHRPPFQGDDHRDTLSRIIEDEAPPARRFEGAIPRDLETIVQKCLRKNARDRYDTAQTLAADLRRFAQGEPVEARPLPPWVGVTRKAWKYSPRIGVIVMAATLIVLLASFLMQTDGIVTRQVWVPAQDIMGGVSPDGRYLSRVNWFTGNLAIHDLETGEDRDVTDEGTWDHPQKFGDVSVWSPDSKQIAYYWIDRGTGSHLKIIGVDGSNPRVLVSSDTAEGHVPWPRAWSSDGKYILALSGEEDEGQEPDHEDHIVFVSVADGSSRVLKELGGQHTRNMSISPDGRYVVYELEANRDSRKRDIHILATDGSSDRPLVEHPADDGAPFWTPDGMRILFLSDRSGTNGLWMLDVDDGKPKGDPRQVSYMGRSAPIGLSQDGSLYYSVGNPSHDIYVATVDLEAGKVLTPPAKRSIRYEGKNQAPAWSPDGKYLAFASRRSEGEGYTLVIQSVETGEERELLSKSLRMSGAIGHSPQWSPDGRSILVSGIANDVTQGDFLFDIETGDFTTVLTFWGESGESEPGPQRPIFSKDGTQLYFFRGRSIMTLDLTTLRESEFHRSRNYIYMLACSPDGRQLAFLEGEEAVVPSEVMTIPISGGEPRTLYTLKEEGRFPRGVGLSWTPDGNHVIVGRPRVGDKTDELWMIPATGGEPRKLDLGFRVTSMALHPDGRRIAFTRGKFNSAVWVMENFLP